MSERLKKKQPLPRWRRILLGLVLAAMVPLIGLMLVNYLAGRQLGAEIVKIGRAGEPITFLDLQADLGQSNTGEDAAGYYVRALSGMTPDDLEGLISVNTFYRKNIISLPTSQFPGDMREKISQNLTDLQPALEEFDKGAGLPLSRLNIGIEQGMQVCRIRLRRIRTAAFLLSLRTLDLMLRGKHDAAVDSAISMLKMTRIFDSQPTMLVHIVKTGLVSLACEDIVLLLEYGNPSEKSLAKLQKVLSESIPEDVLESMFLAERVYQIEMARNFISENITSRFLQYNVPDLPERLPVPSTYWIRLRLRQKSVRYFQDMTQLITAARRPWPEPLDAIVGDETKSTRSGSLLPSGAAFIRLTAKTIAAVRCTILAVAVERYHCSHGKLPSCLDDILHTYIDTIPLDPFTGKKLLYSYDEDAYVVYSVGTNRQDDGGSIKPKAAGKKPQDLGLRIRFTKSE